MTPVKLDITNGWIYDSKGNEFCRMPATCVTAAWEDRAAFIVKACNAHEAYAEAVEAIKIMDDILCFSDKIYDVRERELQGWEGPKVKAYSDALVRYQKAIALAEAKS